MEETTILKKVKTKEDLTTPPVKDKMYSRAEMKDIAEKSLIEFWKGIPEDAEFDKWIEQHL